MTVAANLGSMLLPIGNPQNLFLFQVSDMAEKKSYLPTFTGWNVAFLAVLCVLCGALGLF